MVCPSPPSQPGRVLHSLVADREIMLAAEHTKMEQPSFPEAIRANNQISHIHPPKNKAGHPAQPCPNWAPRGPPESQPTTSTTKGTWTSLMCLTRACQGSRGKGASASDLLLLLNHSLDPRAPAAGRCISTSARTRTRLALRSTTCSTLSKKIHQAGGRAGFEEGKVSFLVTMWKRFEQDMIYPGGLCLC